MAQELDKQLRTAAETGDMNTLQQLIKSGASVNCTDEEDVSTKNHNNLQSNYNNYPLDIIMNTF